jgi:hypothetical protein
VPAAEARLSTSRAERYLTQLSSHLAHGPGGLQIVSTSPGQLVVDLGTATWTIRATPEELLMRVESDNATDLHQQTTRVTHRIEQIARRDALHVNWQPS